MSALTFFYDGECPLCRREIKFLQSHDLKKNINFVDLNSDSFIMKYPQINPLRAQQVLHGQLSSGQIITGLDVTCLAWRLVGKGRCLSVLRWPIFSWFADLSYTFFALNRHAISRYYTYWFGCDKCSK